VAITIRAAGRDDIEQVLLVWLAAGSVPSVSDDAEGVERLLERDPEALLVAHDDGSILGTLVVGWDGWRGNLYRLAVVPGRRREGIAHALVAAARRRLDERGAPRITAIVEDHNDAAVAFWGAAGFSCLPDQSRFVRNR